ncbi:SxtJ family membrane protein [Candidatus Pelagibacter sp. Uisw_099_02]|uniref:SxtJ family membrane protein n=1 Tax=Candidatus Pelagibacter sp. Uisw_099_02 TaxID=3230981 RepID=UPI0039EB19C9
MNKNKIKISSNRSFGVVFFVIFLIISIYPLINNDSIRVWSLIISIFFLIFGLKNSTILTPFNKLWFKFGLFIGSFLAPIVMAVVFFLIITPISLIMKFFGKDVLNLKKNKLKSYWIDKDGPKSKMKDQF